MGDFLRLVDEFNRKERYFVAAYATGGASALTRRGLCLDPGFRAQLANAAGVAEIPESASGYIDYHLDWLHAAVEMAREPGEQPRNNLPAVPTPERPYLVSTGNQEDIDLVVTFEHPVTGNAHLVLVEAKGVGSWTNLQLNSKARRLRNIFGDGAQPDTPEGTDVSFVLLSPQPPTIKRLKTEHWPRWLLGPDNLPHHMPMALPSIRRKVTGCNEDGNDQHTRTFWKAEYTKL
jgi:hypothetical protein